MGIEVNKISSDPASYRRLSDPPDSIELRGGGGINNPSSTNLSDPDHIHVEHGLLSSDDSHNNSSSTGELSGIYFGILNIYQTIPQFIGTFISTVVFAVLEPGKSPELATDAHPSEHHGTDGPNAIAVCLCIGAGAAAIAAVVTRRLKHIP